MKERIQKLLSAAGVASRRQAEELLRGMVDRHPMVLQDPPPMVKVKEHAASSVNLLVRVWCKSEDYWDLQFDLLEQVKLAFDENGGRLQSVILRGRAHCFGLLGCDDDLILPWESIRSIGTDVVMVDADPLPGKHRR